MHESAATLVGNFNFVIGGIIMGSKHFERNPKHRLIGVEIGGLKRGNTVPISSLPTSSCEVK